MEMFDKPHWKPKGWAPHISRYESLSRGCQKMRGPMQEKTCRSEQGEESPQLQSALSSSTVDTQADEFFGSAQFISDSLPLELRLCRYGCLELQ